MPPQEESSRVLGSQDIRPIPDPTVLTTAASLRLEEMLRNLIQVEIAHQAALFTEKLATIETKFETRFAMLDTRTAEQKKDTKDALDAALSAAKEAVASQTAASEKSITKSETATIERIKAVETLLATSTKASDDKSDDLKSRIVAIEAVKLGNMEQTTAQRERGLETRGSMASVMSIVMAVIAVASIIIAIIVVLKP